MGVTYQIIRASSPIALSAGFAVEVPTWSGGGFQYSPTIRAAKSFRQLQVHASFAASMRSGENPSFEYNVASVVAIRRHWFPTFEFNDQPLNNKNGVYLTPGLYRHLSNRFELGIGIPVGVAGAARGTGLVSAFNWEFGGVHDSD